MKTGPARCHLPRLLLTLNCLLVGSVGPLSAQDKSYPWESEPFTGEPKAILEAVGELEIPERAAVHVLLDEVVYRIDDEGKREVHRRKVFRILNRQAFANAVVAAAWSPGRHDRPELDARVIAPDGTTHRLDPKTANEVPYPQANPGVFTDRRILQAPFPALRVGAIVESLTIVRERVDFLDSGAVTYIGLFNNTRDSLLMRRTLIAPSEYKLKHDVIGSDAKVVQTEEDGFVKLQVDIHSPELLKSIPRDLPRDVTAVPYLVASGKGTWQHLAEEYSNAVDEKLDKEHLSQIAATLAADGDTQDDRIRKALAFVQKQVRYTGLEFGAAAIIPRTPQQTLERGYGDCKDQSTLLVGLLRAMEIEADVALINSARPFAVSERHVGLDAFDHVIVCVHRPEPLWIDPTAPFYKAGLLPGTLYAKPALIANQSSEKLVHTPEGKSSDNLRRETYDLACEHDGRALLTIVTEDLGSMASQPRSTHAQYVSKKQMHKAYLEALSRSYPEGKATSYDASDIYDVSIPFKTKSVVSGARFGVVSRGEFALDVSLDTVFSGLPIYLVYEPSLQGFAGLGVERELPVQLANPHVFETQWRIQPPSGYVALELPKGRSFQHGPIQFSQTYKKNDDESVTMLARVDTSDGRLTIEQVKAMRKEIGGWRGTAGRIGLDKLLFVHRGQTLIREKKVKEGFDVYRKLVDESPEDPGRRQAYAQVLLDHGLAWEAQRQAKKAVELSPESGEAHRLLGSLLTHDVVGRRFQYGYDYEGARRHLRRAVELEPEGLDANLLYAEALSYDIKGNRQPAEDAEEALRVARKAFELSPFHTGAQMQLAIGLWYGNLHEELRELLPKTQLGQVANSLQLALEAVDNPRSAGNLIVRTWQNPVHQRTVSRQVLAYLSAVRHYEQAVQLAAALPAGVVVGELEKDIEIISDLKKFDDIRFGDDDPRQVVQDAVRDLIMFQDTEDVIDKYCLSNNHLPFSRLSNIASQVRGRIDTQNSSPVLRRGDVVALYKWTVKEIDDKTIFQVGIDGSEVLMTLYVVKTDEGKLRIVNDPGDGASLALYVLQRLDDGQVDSARQILQWLYDERPPQHSIFNSFSGSPFERTWAYEKRDDPAVMRLAAAMIAGHSHQPKAALKILEDARKTEENKLKKIQIERALDDAYVWAKEPTKCLPIVEALVEASPNSFDARMRYSALMLQLRKVDELQKSAEAELEKSKHTPWALWAMMTVREVGADPLGANEYGRQLLELRIPENTRGAALNTLAWNSLNLDELPDEAIQWAEDAVEISNSSAAAHTAATVFAASGDATQARKLLLDAINLRADRTIRHYDWLTLGLVAETYGLHEAARHAYGKVEDDGTFVGPTLRIAEHRLKLLDEQEKK